MADDPMYHDGMRQLQDIRETRPLADRLEAEFPGCVFVVRITAAKIFPNCPRYLHKMQLVEHSVHSPRPEYTPPTPAWKTSENFRDALPARDRADGSQE